jgi:hypothetical protein
MTETGTRSASDVLDDEPEPDADTGPDESLVENIEGLDADALDAVGIDLAVALLAGALGVAAWDLPRGWLIVSTFALGGVCVMFAEDRRVRAVGALVFAGVLAPLVKWTAFAVMAAGVVAATVAAVYHYDLVDPREVI